MVSAAASSATASATSTPSVVDDLTPLINQMNDQIGKRKAEIDQIKSQMSVYQAAIEQKRQQAATIQSQLDIADNKIAETQLDIRANGLETDATTMQLKQIDSQIQDESLKIMAQRATLAEYIRAIDKNDQHTAIDLFLTQKTLSDFFNDAQAIEQSQRELKRSLDTVQTLKTTLEQQQADQTAKKNHLADIGKQLADAQATLAEQRSAQAVLADQLRVEQNRYSYEVQQLQKQQDAANADIVATERQLRKTLDQDRLRKLSGSSTGWMWPVPSMIVTTYFHDPDYPFRYLFEHPGVDIRAAQGTPVRAARGGYVATAHDGGMNYSYIMIVHDGGLATVYGHVSKILVRPDTYVQQGDVIALSGATPGTPGAGPYTTAAHLHFEVRQDGIPVNPLNYLQQ